MNIKDILGKNLLFFDGALGTSLQKRGLQPSEVPEDWNITKPEILIEIHREYLQAGANILTINTFGASKWPFQDNNYSLEEVVFAAVNNARKAIEEHKAAQAEDASKPFFVALDIGPTGKLLKPLGDLHFDDAYEAFKAVALAGVKAGVDLALIETMSDSYELKAAILAVKESTSLPIFATASFDEQGKLLTGSNVPSFVALLEGLGVTALGINCGLGPVQMEKIVFELLECASTPVIVTPNAGLPQTHLGELVYDINAEQFGAIMRSFAEKGVSFLGGCCGTTPEHIALMTKACKGLLPKAIQPKNRTVVSSYSKALILGDDTYIVGERINPTGKARFKQALRENDLSYILREALSQEENGAHVLDVNVGLPEIDEVAVLTQLVTEIQSIVNIPLQIDTSNPEAMDKALRYYNGKALINSVNGKQESMDAVFPLMQKYGGLVIGLTLDEDGIPETAEGRLAVAEKMVTEAAKYGIDKKDLVIDVLCMAISADETSALTALEAIRLVKEKLGVRTLLGVSNSSFGLPKREAINSSLYLLAMFAGLDLAIINPNSPEMMQAYHCYRALTAKDKNFTNYIAQYADNGEKKPASSTPATAKDLTLEEAIQKGLKDEAGRLTELLLADHDPLDIINNKLIVALNIVGEGFEKGTLFLPQLLMSAEAAKSSFEAIKISLAKAGIERESKGKVLLATVKGDIHDIGKNIVKVLLENYDFQVFDLGKDVPAEHIVEKALEHDISLIGLSALMTTTVPSMDEAIKALRQKKPDCKIMVGGAVLTEEYANMIGADFYAKDAMASVSYAQKTLKI